MRLSVFTLVAFVVAAVAAPSACAMENEGIVHEVPHMRHLADANPVMAAEQSFKPQEEMKPENELPVEKARLEALKEFGNDKDKNEQYYGRGCYPGSWYWPRCRWGGMWGCYPGSWYWPSCRWRYRCYPGSWYWPRCKSWYW